MPKTLEGNDFYAMMLACGDIFQIGAVRPADFQLVVNSAMDVTKQDVFMPQETQDNPFDITLMVEDATEFKAHRKVLSEASPFFEKLLTTDMMESKKGVIRLEMLTEAGLRAVLEFIYTGNVQILDEEHARGLIEMADYLFILPLKTLAQRVLAQTLNTSNCISTYNFAERYQCEELVFDAKKIIHINFTNVAKAEEFLNMSSEEVNQWISSEEIVVSAEEDVFKIILSWINHNKSERKKYFADLFRQVRLIYVSPDYLHNDIVTNDLVNDNACCLELVKAAMKAIDTTKSEIVSFPPPRKLLETPVIVVDGIYALESESEISCPDCVSLHSCNEPERESELFPCGKQHLFYITKYKPESNSWKDITSFDFGLRKRICIVAKDNFVYFIGGYIQETDRKFLTNVDRYDFSKRKWDKLANLQEARARASGTARQGKIFITGGLSTANTSPPFTGRFVNSCEVYNETTNEWQFIARAKRHFGSITCVDDKVYVVDNLCYSSKWGYRGGIFIECYDPDKDEWNFVTKMLDLSARYKEMKTLNVRSCSMRLFIGTKLQWTIIPLPWTPHFWSQRELVDRALDL
ncbi:hypothetical protein ACROYT_G040919 [Oculina patagonica]